LKTNSITNEKLRWVRIFDPLHIPREYIDQIKQKEFTTDRFYDFLSNVCLVEHEFGLCVNPNNWLFVLVDDITKTKGILWMVVDSLANALVINTFSVDKEYWGNGKAVEWLREKALEIKDQEGLERVYWITRSPKHSEKFGFKRSKNVLMEYQDGKFSKGDTDGQGCEASRGSSANDKRTTEIFKEGS
jgi:hypothetical protein